MGSPVTLSHLTLSDPERLRCRIWSKIDTCIVRYYVRGNPHFNWFSLQQWIFGASLQKIANVTPTAAVKQTAKVLVPLVEFHHCTLWRNQKPQLSGKRATTGRNRVKFGPRGWVFSVYKVFLTVKWLRSFWSLSVHSDFRQACISKMAGCRAERTEIWASGVSIRCTQATFDT